MDQKLKSLSIFFPFYNDEGTVLRQIEEAYKYGGQVADDLEVIALHGGNSRDGTWMRIQEVQAMYPDLKVVNKNDNKEGYAVIKHGFNAATKEWVFYTDGDAQYHLDDLYRLVDKHFQTNYEVINGYKLKRGDSAARTIGGNLYALFSTFIFDLPIRDTDCDFRLIKRSILDRIKLQSSDSSILGELIKKLELEGARFAEVPVRHYEREYGESNYTAWKLFKEKLIGDITLYFKLRKYNPLERLRIFKFAFVGIVSILVQFVFFNLILLYVRGNHPFNMPDSIAVAFYAILADQIAIVSSFILNNHITFTDRKVKYNREGWGKFIRLYVIIIASTMIQALVIYIGTSIFGVGLISSNIFFTIGLGIAFFWNYFFQKRFVYQK